MREKGRRINLLRDWKSRAAYTIKEKTTTYCATENHQVSFDLFRLVFGAQTYDFHERGASDATTKGQRETQ